MSIANEIQALQQDKNDIATALIHQGATVPVGSGFDNFANIISSFPISRFSYFEDYATKTPKADEPFIREADGTIHYIEHTVDFTPKGLIFSCGLSPTNLNGYLPEISGKTTRSIYNISYGDNSIWSGYYSVNTGLQIAKGTSVSYALIPTNSYEITSNIIKIGKPDSSINAFRFGMTDNISIVGKSAGVIYQIFVFG
ncbi:MAG: hypothetical protein IJT84_04130 [Clostridia bacterium]|nr:hypothetical protein [Clostridia bacterium]